MRQTLLSSVTVLLVLTLCGPASARWFGSTMQGPANAAYGCEAAAIYAPAGGIELAPSNQTSCTYRHGGYLNQLRPGSLVPANGRIRRIRVLSGPDPARLRLTILTGSSRVDTRTGRDIPGTYTCCTARFLGRPFRPRPNAVTVRRTNVRVFVTHSRDLRNRLHTSDVVAISAFGPGTLPLRGDPNIGAFDDGTPLSTGYWGATLRGDPRVDGYTMPGIDVLFGWDFRPNR